MKKSFLSQYIIGVATKCPSAVETDAKLSNQYEFNVTTAMKSLFRRSDEKRKSSISHTGATSQYIYRSSAGVSDGLYKIFGLYKGKTEA